MLDTKFPFRCGELDLYLNNVNLQNNMVRIVNKTYSYLTFPSFDVNENRKRTLLVFHRKEEVNIFAEKYIFH